MCKFFKRKKKIESEKIRFAFAECVFKTMKSEIIRCQDINVYFSCPENMEISDYISHDKIRQAMIKIAYVFSYSNILESKLSFEGAIRLELNKMLENTDVKCDRVNIHNITKIR